MANPPPSFDLRETSIAEVAHLFARFHAYRSTGNVAVYAFAVFERTAPVAAFLWQPPPPGAAKSICAELPHGVLTLSRMVAVPKEERRLKHISKPLKHQMRRLIDRTRWPVLATFSDESVGHTGHVYKCSGWQKTDRRRARTLTTPDGRRVSRYSNGEQANHVDATSGHAWIQRWEHWACDREHVADMFYTHWDRVAIPGKTWRSGAQAYTYERKAQAC